MKTTPPNYRPISGSHVLLWRQPGARSTWRWQPPLARMKGLLAVLVLLAATIPPPVTAQPMEEPTWIRRDPVSVHLHSVAYGLNRFIAVGQFGYWFTSPNAQSWTVRAPFTDRNLSSVHFAHGRFVAAGDGLYSTADGVNWTRADLPDTRLYVTDVAADDAGNWLAVGYTLDVHGSARDYLTYTSADGVNWNRHTLIGPPPTRVAFGHGRWLGASAHGGPMVRWAERETEPGVPPQYWWEGAWFFQDDHELLEPQVSLVRFLNGRFIVVARRFDESGVPEYYLLISADGETWETREISDQGDPWAVTAPRRGFLRDLMFGDGVYVGLAASAPHSPLEAAPASLRGLLRSGDGEDWSFIDTTELGSLLLSRALTSVIHINGQFLAVGYTSAVENRVVASSDGETWTSRSFSVHTLQLSSLESLVSLAAGNGLVIGVTTLGGAVVSEDRGILWGYAEVTHSSPALLRTVAYGGGLFVAAGVDGRAYRTSDGYSWNSVQVPDVTQFFKVIHDGTQFVASGTFRDAGNNLHGIITRSPDGISWTTVQPENTLTIEGLAYGNGVYLAFAPGLLRSTDAVNWSPVTGAPSFSRIAYGGGRFLAVVPQPRPPTYYTSVNGTDWIPLDSAGGGFWGASYSVETLTYVNGHFAHVGNEMGVHFLVDDYWEWVGGPTRADLTFLEDTYIASSIWTYRPSPPPPPLVPPRLTWQRTGANSLRLHFPTRLEHRYQLWFREGWGQGTAWIPGESFLAGDENGSFDVSMDPSEAPEQYFQVTVESPEGGF